MVVTGGPASMATFSTWDDDTAANPTTGEETRSSGHDSSFVTVEEPLATDEGMLADFLAGHHACYTFENGGAPLADGLANLANNQIWTKGRDMQNMKDELARYPRLENPDIHKVDLNDDVLGLLQQNKLLQEEDFKLQVMQEGVGWTTVPVLQAIEAAAAGAVDKQVIVDLGLDTVVMLGHVNGQVNNL